MKAKKQPYVVIPGHLYHAFVAEKKKKASAMRHAMADMWRRNFDAMIERNRIARTKENSR